MVESRESLAEILEAALCQLDEGIAVLDAEACVLFWNPAAAAITGYFSQDLLGHTLPPEAYRIDIAHRPQSRSGTLWDRNQEPGSFEISNLRQLDSRAQDAHPVLVHLHHRQGHTLPAMLRRTPLRDALGRRFGTLLRFHPVEEIDALPHGMTDPDSTRENRVEQSQGEMQVRLDEAGQEFTSGAIPFGILWITVDQAAMLRKTHGRDASEAMMAIVERAILHGLRPAEVIGRWGDNEFLVLSHERSEEMLSSHAQNLAALAHHADFRWWGDRIPLTLSIGAAQAESGETLRCLLLRAQQAMGQSLQFGGDRAATQHNPNPGGPQCSQS